MPFLSRSRRQTEVARSRRGAGAVTRNAVDRSDHGSEASDEEIMSRRLRRRQSTIGARFSRLNDIRDSANNAERQHIEEDSIDPQDHEMHSHASMEYAGNGLPTHGENNEAGDEMNSDYSSVVSSSSGTICTRGFEGCLVCGRDGNDIGLDHVATELVRFKIKFCKINKSEVNDSNGLWACSICRAYVTKEGSNTYKDASLVWPSFVAEGLRQRDGRKLWRLLPLNWRGWWASYVVQELEWEEADTWQPEVIVERSRERDEFVYVMSHLSDVSYGRFKTIVESTLSVPLARCPWGCAEFVGRAGTIPLDVFFSAFFGFNKTYSKESLFQCNRGFRRDLLGGQVNILDNPEWPCMPTLVMEEGVPLVLCCRYHGTSHTMRYLHPPPNPSGSISFHDDNMFAPVVALPRTMVSFKSKHFTNSYTVNRAIGTYSGLDTVNLTTEIPGGERTHLGVFRSALCHGGREDYAIFADKFLETRCCNSSERASCEHLIDQGIDLKRSGMALKSAQGSTFIPISEVYSQLVATKRTGTARVLVLDNGEEVPFTARWPRTLARVGTVGDVYGEAIVPYNGCKGIGDQPLWSLMNALHVVPELWEQVDLNCKTASSWEGWTLGFLYSRIVRRRYGPTTDRCVNPFTSNKCTLAKIREIMQAIQVDRPADPNISDNSELLTLFSKALRYESVLVSENYPARDRVQANHAIIIVGFNTDGGAAPSILETMNRGYTLKAIVMHTSLEENKGRKIYYRETSQSRFWTLTGDFCHKATKDHRSVNVLLEEESLKRRWGVLVYCRDSEPDFEAFKQTMLELNGASHRIKCSSHPQCCLVTCPFRRPLLCSKPACKKRTAWVCAMDGCDYGLCSSHERSEDNIARSITERRRGGVGDEHVVRDESMEEAINERIDSEDNSIEVRAGSHENEDYDSNDDSSYDEESESAYDEELSYDNSLGGHTLWSGNDAIDDEEEDNNDYEDEADNESLESSDSMSKAESYTNALDDIPDEEYKTYDVEEDHEGFLENVVEQDNDSDEDQFGYLPTTNAGHTMSTYSGVHELKRDGKLIPSHLLLNTEGNLLIRHRRNLGKGTTASRHFLQSLVSTLPGRSVPLAYPEATVNPSMFYYGEADGSIAGAIPVSMLQDGKVLASKGIASLYDMYRTRYLDPTLLSSTNHAYQAFCWDAIANLSLRGVSPELFWRRGFLSVPDYNGTCFSVNNEPLYDTHYLDSRTAVNQLAAANARKTCDLFFTFTCNQAHTLGVRNITKWVRSFDAQEQVRLRSRTVGCIIPENDIDATNAIGRALEESAGIYMVRAWNEIVQSMLKYIQYGKDSPFQNVCGGVKDIFDRAEIQSELDGKVPHHHVLLFLSRKAETDEDILSILNLIRGAASTLFTEEEWAQAKEKGFVENGDVFMDFILQAERLLTHHCTTRCMVKVKTITADGTYEFSKERKCKQPDINKASPNPLMHCLPIVHVDHSEMAIQAMLWMRLICKKRDPETEEEKLVANDDNANYLESRKHFPPCPPTVRPMSPANPFLFCMFLSAINLQYCTMYILLRYLTKYVATVDKAVKFQIRAEKEDQYAFKVTSTDDHNTKITGNRIEANQRKYNPCYVEGRNLSMSEMQMQMLKYGMVNTTFSYKQIPTAMMALRPVMKKPSRIQRLKKNGQLDPQNFRIPRDLNVGQVFPCQEARRLLRFDNWRMFEKYQVVSYLDSIYQPASLDKITLFGLRPPELRWVDQPKYYLTWFERKSAIVSGCSHDLDKETTELREILKQDVAACPWVDATGTQIVIRASAIAKARKYLKNLPDARAKEYFGTDRTRSKKRAVDRVLEKLEVSFFGMRLRQHRTRQSDPYIARFALETPNSSGNYKALPIYWFRPVRSSETEAFLHHLLLSMGRFTTELELLSQGNLKKAFIRAGLMTESSDPNVMEESVRTLANQYNKEQLQYHPMGTRRLGIELHTMQKTLRNFFLQDRIESTSLPSALFTKIRTECLTDIETYCHQTQLKLAESLLHHLSQIFQGEEDLPKIEQVFPAVPTERVHFDPLQLRRNHQQQSELSYKEHYEGYLKSKKMIEHYSRATLERTLSLALVGGGGVGKSTAARVNALCYLCDGLFVVCTTLMGKRACEWGSEHIHLRCKFPVNDRTSVSQRAEKAYRNLLKDPKRLEILRRVDVLLIDELGQLDAKTIAVLDLLLKKIRRNTHFFGGVIVLATMDVRQLKPINDMPPLMLPAMQSSFTFHEFKVPLRTTDPDHQRIQEITRMSRDELGAKDGDVFREFSTLITTKCTFVESISSPEIPKNAIYCFPRRKIAKTAEEKVLEQLKENYRDVYKTKVASDSEETPFTSETYRASNVTSQALDRFGKTPQTLYFFPWASYEVTFNDPAGNFAQSQLCLLPEVPSDAILDEFQPIKLLRAPAGVDEIPDIFDEDLLINGYNWKPIYVGMEPEKRHYLGQNGLYGCREQYGLRHRISCTIHAIMGASASYLVTQVSTLEDETMWEAAQVVVLLSRTRCAKNICFVGESSSTIDALWSALTTKDQFTDFVSGLLKSLLSGTPSQFNDTIQDDFPYRPKDWALPPAGEYCCYMLLSLSDKRKTYIGMTGDMGKRLNQHNSRHGGSNVTSRIHLKPWAILGYVKGFTSRDELRDFEQNWQKEVERAQQQRRRNLDPLQRFELSTNLLARREYLKRTLCVDIRTNA